MGSIDISEARFEYPAPERRLDAITLTLTLTRAFSVAVSAGNLTDQHRPRHVGRRCTSQCQNAFLYRASAPRLP